MGAAALATQILRDAPYIYSPLDDFTGATVRNLGSASSLTGTPANLASDSPGIDGQTRALFGIRANNPQIAYADDPLHDSTSITFELWLRVKRDAQATYFMSRASHTRWQLNADHTVGYLDTNATGTGSVTSSVQRALFDRRWHQHVVVWDETDGIYLYFDGAQIGYQANGNPQGTSASTLYIGRRPTSSPDNPVDGSMAHFAAFPSALSADRVLAHYNAAMERPTRRRL